jgi:plasmid stabilization system protein ParE
MIYFLEFVGEALDEAEEATNYYEEIQPGLGLRFREELEAVTQAIVSQPLLWRERIGGFRRVNLPGFPFYVSYFLRGHKILIAAIAQANKHPDYWKDRI